MRRVGRWRRTADPREHRDVRRGAERVDAQRMSTNGGEYHRTGRNPTVQSVLKITTEEWDYAEEQQVVKQATEESQNWCIHEMHACRHVGCRSSSLERMGQLITSPTESCTSSGRAVLDPIAWT